jgi:hypothetical protein
MNNKMTTLIFTFFLAFSLQAQEKVTVEIDFGGEKPNETYQIDWYEGMTAMTALQSVATIESYPIQSHIFVTTINGIRTNPGEMAWYYTVNNESRRVLSFRNPVKSGDVIRWIYKKDVCTPTADEQ